MKKLILAVSTLLLTSGIIFSQNMRDSIFNAVKDQKSRDAKTLEETKKQVDDIRKQIIAENKKFQVGITWAIKQNISKITGDKPLPNIPKPKPKPKPVQPIEKPKPVQPVEKPKPSDPIVLPKPGIQDKPVTPEKPVTPLKPDPVPIIPVPLISVDPNQSAFNWRDKGMLTPIRFQGLCGSCWAFAAMAVYESVYLINYKTTLDLSEQYIVDCAVLSDGRDAGSCDGGSYWSVFAFLLDNGAVEEKMKPYKAKNTSCGGVLTSNYRVVEWKAINDGKFPTVRQIKEAVAKYGPVAASVKVTPAFQAYTGGIFDEFAKVSNQYDTNHAIVIVGWDDSKKSFLIKNSWGEDWGEKGYMWIEYGCNNIGRGASYITVGK